MIGFVFIVDHQDFGHIKLDGSLITMVLELEPML